MKPTGPLTLNDILILHLTDELDQEIEQVLKDKNQTPEDIAKRTEAMNENRTEYRRNNR
jgi:hypothetical protein